MTDVFISYSSQDRAAARRVVEALEAAGLSVFWDQTVPPGQDWNRWIGEKLGESRAVVVLWSRASVASGNVVHEATIANTRGKLVPALVEDLSPEDFPMGFYTLQAADLRKSGELEALVAAVRGRLDGTHPGAPATRGPKRAGAPPRRMLMAAGGIVALAVTIAIGATLFSGGQLRPTAEGQASAPGATSAAGACQQLAAMGIPCTGEGLLQAAQSNQREAIGLAFAAGLDGNAQVTSDWDGAAPVWFRAAMAQAPGLDPLLAAMKARDLPLNQMDMMFTFKLSGSTQYDLSVKEDVFCVIAKHYRAQIDQTLESLAYDPTSYTSEEEFQAWSGDLRAKAKACA